ncbi:uncharacterized protein LOC134675901 [Cydia fagiglandana]|uniref:uncharacterized protein LOC134675901 n=1 Tax=Cydia fagiglandana TaxID=1458189 RepID=UPI002FEE35B9
MVVLHFIIIAIIFGPIVSITYPKEFPFLKTQINDEKHATAFNKLLNSIVKINRKRLDTINKLTKLQAMDVYPSLQDTLLRTSSRRDRIESSSESDEKNVIYLVIPDTNSTPNVSHYTQPVEPPAPTTEQPKQPPVRSQPDPRPQSIPTLEDYSKLKSPNPTPIKSSIQTISKDGLDALRVSIERSCKSREVKKCRNACKAAVKSACDVYECKKKLRKKLKKTCKKECKDEFKGGW